MGKKTLYFYIIAILMMYNDALFTWLGIMTGLVFWRQLIWAIGMIIVAKFVASRSRYHDYISLILRKYKGLFIYIFFISLITLLFDGWSIVRIGYAVVEYAFPIPFILFPYVAYNNGWSRSKINRFFILIGLFLSTGLIADFLTGGLFTNMFSLAFTSELATSSMSSGRYSFLSTANSIFTVYYSFSLMSCFHEYTITGNSKIKPYLLLFSIYFIFACIFCGARQTLVALVIVEAFGIYTIMKSSPSSIITVALVAVIIIFALPYARNILSSNDGFSDRYSTEALKEDTRKNTWKLGLDECIIHPSFRRATIGDGFSYVCSMKAAPGEPTGRHYENTFLARISEMGIIAAIFSLILPVYYLFKYRKRVHNFGLYFGVILSYLFICSVSPNGSSGQTQLTMLILLGLFFEEAHLENYNRT